jgi:DNA-binding HxlR family transcriptional regulator
MPTPSRRIPPVSALDAALHRVGDRWSLLLVESLLPGPRRFGELLDGLDGLAPNILSRRLKDLEAEGILAARPYSQRPRRVTYALTASGAELAGALRLLAQWGALRSSRPSPVARHVTCGTPVEARFWCRTCERVVDDDETPDLDYV